MKSGFVEGGIYSGSELDGHVWPPVDPGAQYVRRAGYFEEVPEPGAFGLVPAAEVADAIAELRRRGLGPRDVAEAAGISDATARRAWTANGHLRRSTRDAILRAAAMNGH